MACGWAAAEACIWEAAPAIWGAAGIWEAAVATWEAAVDMGGEP